MTKLELQNKIATIEKSMAKITNPAVLAIAEKNLKEAREQLAALEGAMPSPAPSGGGSELEKLYEQRERLTKGLQSSNAVVQKASKMALPKVEAKIAELEGASPAPAPARRMPKPKAETPEVPATKAMPTPAKRGRKPSPPAPMPIPTPAKRGRKPKAEAPMPMPTPAKRGRKPKAEAPMPMPTPAKRGRKPKAEAPAEVKGKIKRGRKPKVQAPAEAPAVTPARRGRPALPKGAKSQEVSLNSLTKLANAIVEFCRENGIANPTIDDVRGILGILDKGKALKFAKGGKISRSGKYLSKWQIKQILTDGGMKIGSDEILSGVWLKKKVNGVAEMRMGGEIGYFVIDDDILESGKSVMLGNRRISAKNKKFQGVFEGKMVGGLMKVYDYDDEMWKVVNPDEWQQAYAEGGGVGRKLDFESREYDMPRGKTIYSVEVENEYDDDETITEEYDNYDEAISAYRRSKLRFPITWRTYLETQKPPFVYESGIVLQDGTLKVISRKGKDVNYDFNGNEKYAEGGGVGEKRYFLTGYSAYASYDSYDEGEGENVSNWDDKISKTFSSKDDLINYISKNITYTDHTESDFDWEIGDGKYIVTSVLCSYGDDGGYYPASKSEIDQWKKGKKELYNVDYFIDVVAAIPTEYAKGGGVGNSTITDLADFDPETTLVFDGDADFADYPEITDLGNLQTITGDAYFDDSEVQDLGNLQIIQGVAIFKRSKVKDLGNLQRIGSSSYFGKRIDLQKQWEKRASEDELEEIVSEDAL
jgi:hypothetical protein